MAQAISVGGNASVQTNLSEKINQLREINHMIAHNLRGPASNIKMLAELLMGNELDEPNNNSDLTNHDAIQYIHESSTALLDSLCSLLDAAETEMKEDQAEDCDVAGIVAQIQHQLQGLIATRHATITLRLALPRIRYQQIYLESILYNFINNALKYSRPGVPARITISSFMEAGRQVLRISDNGIGIDLSTSDGKLFAHPLPHAGYESKGLGLYLTKMHVESFGGSVSVRSTVNEGTEFTIVL